MALIVASLALFSVRVHCRPEAVEDQIPTLSLEDGQLPRVEHIGQVRR